MAKIIPIFKTPTLSTLPMSTLMIKTLKRACNMQKNNQPFGQVDLNGSFMALLNRDYIACKTILVYGIIQVTWFVTLAGIDALKKSA